MVTPLCGSCCTVLPIMQDKVVVTLGVMILNIIQIKHKFIKTEVQCVVVNDKMLKLEVSAFPLACCDMVRAAYQDCLGHFVLTLYLGVKYPCV